MDNQLVHHDEDLNIAALRQQDPAEFEQLYRIFAPSLQRYLIRLCRDPHLADDLLQDTFRKAYCAFPSIAPDIQLRPWLYAIATNTARSAARHAYWRRVHSCNDAVLEQQSSAQCPLEAQAVEAELVERTFRALKPDDASLVLLHWHEGFSIDELCRMLALPRDTLKKRLYRAKKAFSAAYAYEYAMQPCDAALI